MIQVYIHVLCSPMFRNAFLIKETKDYVSSWEIINISLTCCEVSFQQNCSTFTIWDSFFIFVAG